MAGSRVELGQPARPAPTVDGLGAFACLKHAGAPNYGRRFLPGPSFLTDPRFRSARSSQAVIADRIWADSLRPVRAFTRFNRSATVGSIQNEYRLRRSVMGIYVTYICDVSRVVKCVGDTTARHDWQRSGSRGNVEHCLRGHPREGRVRPIKTRAIFGGTFLMGSLFCAVP